MKTISLQNLMVLAFRGIKILPQNYLSIFKEPLIIEFDQQLAFAVMA